MAMNSRAYFQYLASNPTGVALTTTVGHGTEHTGSAKIYSQGKIRVLLTTATAGKSVSATITTPIAFKVLGIVGQSVSSANSAKVLTVYNTTTAIGTVTAATAESSAVASLDLSQTDFSIDDDDLLVVLSGSSAGSAVVILDIVFT